MSEVGLNENVSIGSRIFHLQTASVKNHGLIKTEIFEKGRLLHVVYKHFERRKGENEGPNQRIRKLVEDFHQNIVKNISQIFDISSRVFEMKDAMGHYRVGILFYSLNLYDEAEQHFNEVIKLNKKFYFVYRYLIKLSIKQKKLKKAVMYKNELLAYNEIRYADLFNVIGLVDLLEGNSINSIQFFKKAIEQNPTYLEALLNLFYAFLKSYLSIREKLKPEEFEKKHLFLTDLLKKIRKACQVNFQKKRFTFVNPEEMEDLLKMREFEQLVKLLEKYQERFFAEEENYRILGHEIYVRVKYSMEQLSEEEINFYQTQLESVLQDHPEYSDLWSVLGLIYLVRTRYLFVESENMIKKALQLNEKYENAGKNLRLVQNDGREIISLLNSILR